MEKTTNWDRVLQYLFTLSSAAMSIGVGMYVYLGVFTRPLADDYCETLHVTGGSLLEAVFERYSIGAWRAANRYSNILFVGFSENLGDNAYQITTASMILLWTAGLVWCVYEFRRFLKLNWGFQNDLFFGASLSFFSLLQAPNLFQTIYWRSSMMTHFAPLAFGSLVLAFWLRQVRSEHRSSLGINIFFLVGTYILSGFSEPPTTTMVTVISILLVGVWFWGREPVRKKYLAHISWPFAGAFLGLMTLVLSPAGVNSTQDRSLNVFEILVKSFKYAYEFMANTIRTQPLPILLTILIPLLLFWFYAKDLIPSLSAEQTRRIWYIMIASPFVVWFLISAGFAPSAYGQGFPVERMRFLARFLMISAFMLDGGLLGILLQNSQLKLSPTLGQWIAIALFAFASVVYPLRRAAQIIQLDLPEYSNRAMLWDLREAFMIRHSASGDRELVVPGFSGVYHIKELDSDPNHWVNVCAANLYGVDTIRSVTVPVEQQVEFLNE